MLRRLLLVTGRRSAGLRDRVRGRATRSRRRAADRRAPPARRLPSSGSSRAARPRHRRRPPTPTARPIRAEPRAGPARARTALLGPGDTGTKVRDLQARLQADRVVRRPTSPATYDEVTIEARPRLPGQARDPGHRRGRPAHARPAARDDHRAHPATSCTTARQRARRARRALPDRPGALHRQDQPDAALGGRRQGAADRSTCGSGRRTPRPARASSTSTSRAATTCRSSTARRCRTRCSSPAARRCTTRRTSRRAATPAPRTAASTSATTTAVARLYDQVQVGDKVVVYWS